ncbi:hypothetical protein MMC09_002319 [Bachmanniomyces sp. S44760]|nr:hypothetical protein [Bachmanniomyces sp. S44760]
MDISRLIGHAKISFHHHPNPISLLSKQKGKEVAQTLLEIARATTPPCNLNPFLFNGHLQTAYTAITPYDVPVYYKRHVFSAEDPAFTGTFAVDFAVPAYSECNDLLPPRTTYYKDAEFEGIKSMDSKPMLVTLHGLSGGSHEIYLRHCLKPLLDSGEWEACVVNSRGCARSQITSSVLYNARATWDVRQTVKWLRGTFPNRPLFGIGFSLGANILTNYLGEEGSGCLLKAAVICSNPWNLEAGSLALRRSWLGLNLYSKTMGTNLKALFETHVDEMSKNPNIDIEKVRALTYLHEFDRTPLFAIHALDDPIAVDEALPYEEFRKNPYAVLCTTSLGGHLSWFEMGGGRWFARAATHFLMKMANDIDLSSPVSSPNDLTKDRPADKKAPFWDPMIRKLHIHVPE